MSIEIGSLLKNRYRIDAVIARGGMGAIYRGTDESLGIQVAVKENLTFSEDAARQFRKEASILAGLRHPHLPRVTDHFIITDGGQYLVMDFIEGEDLRQRISRLGSLPEEEAILIGVAIADALAYLHSRQPVILHRDIKPGNIKITPAGELYLVDFGLAKISQSDQTTTGAQALTPGYAPPEQYGAGSEIRSDIYSLAATLYTALTGAIPEDSLARAMNSTELTPIRDHNPAVSPKVASVIEAALAIAAEQRPASAEHFREALLTANTQVRRKYAQMGTARITPAGDDLGATVSLTHQPTARPAPKATKSKAPLALLISGAIILLAICGGSGWFFRDAIFPPVAAVSLTVDAPPTTAAPPLVDSDPTQMVETAKPETSAASIAPEITAPTEITPTVQATPIGGGSGQIAFASDRSGIPQIWLMDSDGNNPIQITNLPDGACQPEWSPDSSRLVITSPCPKFKDSYEGSSLFLIHNDGSGLTPLVSKPGGDFDPAWSPDGSRIAFTSLRQGSIPYVYLYDLGSNTSQRITKTSTNERRPAWSPDGNWIAFESTRLGDSQIWTMNTSGEAVREQTGRDSGAASYPTWTPAGDVILFSLGARNPIIAAREVNVPAAPVVRLADLSPALNAKVSPDGYWVVLQALQNGKLNIYRMTINGAMLTAITDTSTNDFDPVWRP